MKTAIKMFLFAAASEAAAATGGAAVAKVIELTSPELVKLNVDLKASWAKQRAIEDMDSTEFSEAATETLAIKSAIAKEKARLVKEANDQKLAELRKAVVSDFDAIFGLKAKAENPKATDEDKTAYNNAYEAIINKLLGTAPKVANVSGAPKSGTKSEQILSMMLAGNTYDQILAAGNGDGTIRSVANTEKMKKNADGTYTKRV